MEMIIQDLASPHARNVEGKVNDTGQKITAPTLWNNIIFVVIFVVTSDKLYSFKIHGNVRYVMAIVTAILTYTIPSIFLL